MAVFGLVSLVDIVDTLDWKYYTYCVDISTLILGAGRAAGGQPGEELPPRLGQRQQRPRPRSPHPRPRGVEAVLVSIIVMNINKHVDVETSIK